MGILYDADRSLLSKYFEECANLLGTRAQYYKLLDSQSDLYEDPNAKYDNPVPINILFEDYPKVTTLKKLGWYDEDDQSLPIIAYLPQSVEVMRGSRLDLPSPQSVGGANRMFIITDIKSDNYVGTTYWVCKLAPIYDQDSYTVNYNNNYSYIQE